MSSTLFNFKIIDSHTGGEPTRMVYAGFPDLTGDTIQDKLQCFKQNFDHLRQSIILEPRGNEVLVGALLLPATNPDATAGVIFFNNTGYLGMCGHGTIGVIASLAYQQKISAGEHWLETSVGLVKATLHDDGSCSVQNVPSYRYKKQVAVQVPNVGLIRGDIAWGGNWFFLVSDHGQDIHASNVKPLTHICLQIKQALIAANITGEDGGEIDHIELFADSDDAQADSKNFVLCPGGAYDRSPCGTGTSAKLACLAADNRLAPEQPWQQQGVVGSVFTGSYQYATDRHSPYELNSLNDHNNSNDLTHLEPRIVPTICGYAHVCAETLLIVQEDDPFKWGIPS
ncbi:MULTISPECIES: proline racemase family protein [unclassified Psychrobacter]|uniref:proline racemase family protein n=1 Tax=unclassified Psychrobacter TaxID=196806 RepID=UPI0025B55E69|nr:MULTISPECIES: proline racemase family protein [unclassified Psychrobacter]MDN3452324.1 proline racemase family protein [Psychrobacter sp. APC 3350]MDN3502257.1 proline racemase family protein [Psychrobacter sp. 5A.1]